jgi:hypothetical protein
MSGIEPKLKKSYSRPQLVSHGSVEDLTKGVSADNDDAPSGGGSED